MKKHLSFLFGVAFSAVSLAQSTPQLSPDNIDKVVKNMTIEEKARMCMGIGVFWMDVRNSRDVAGVAGGSYEISRLGIPTTYFGDGPMGIRLNETRGAWDSHHYYATAFPAPITLASSWDPSLITETASIMGYECKEHGVDVLLGPGINIERNPLGGRTQEYYSEDPYLTGKLGAAFVKGVQSAGVGASVKHFAANSQETQRNSNNARISKRALREIYLKGFEIVVKESDPWTLMTSYNGLNGKYTSENRELLEDVLRKDWGFKGMVMTDWGGGSDIIAQLMSGNDLSQPGVEQKVQEIVAAVKEEKLSENYLDNSVKRVLNTVVKTWSFKKHPFSNNPDKKIGTIAARKAAAESAVLLKNENNTLPFNNVKNIALYGVTAYNLIPGGIGYKEEGAGNYHVTLIEGLRKAEFNVDDSLIKTYMQHRASEEKRIFPNGKPKFPTMGKVDEDPQEHEFSMTEIDNQLIKNDIAVIVLGHPGCEGVDRKKEEFYLTVKEKKLISDVCERYHAAHKKVVVVLNIPGPIETASWKSQPDAILCAWQGGEQFGNALADLLSGKVNPSAKLPVTFANDLMDYSSSANFPIANRVESEAPTGQMQQNFEPGMFDKLPKYTIKSNGVKNKDYTNYEEDIYVGYRYFDTFKKNVSYPFGFGLSYTNFNYSNASITHQNSQFTITLKVTNTGKVSGREVVQIYVAAPKSKLDKPVKELKAFSKTAEIASGKSETITIVINEADLASFDEKLSSWVVAKGTYKFLVAASVTDIKNTLEGTVNNESIFKVSDVLAPDVPLKTIKN